MNSKRRIGLEHEEWVPKNPMKLHALTIMVDNHSK